MPLPALAIGGIATGIGSLLGSVFNGIFGSSQNSDNIENQWKMLMESEAYNTSERESAQRYNTGERLAVQDYNSPIQQLQRFSQAGVNPNSAVGAITGNSSQSQSISPASVSGQFTNVASPWDFFQLSQAALTGSQIAKTNAEAKRQEIENNHLEKGIELTQKQQDRAIKLADAQIKKTLSDANYSDQQREQAETLLPLLVKKGKLEINNFIKALQEYDKKIVLLQTQNENAKKEGALLSAQTATEHERTKVIGLEKRRAEFYQSLMDAGLDPNTDFYQNVMRIVATDPQKGRQLISNLADSAKEGVDQALEDIPSVGDFLFSGDKDSNGVYKGFVPKNLQSIWHFLNP